jgi:hypothetical protein
MFDPGIKQGVTFISSAFFYILSEEFSEANPAVRFIFSCLKEAEKGCRFHPG